MISASGGPIAGLMPLTAEMQSGGARSCWMGYIAVNDVDKAAADIKEAGGSIHMEPFDIPEAGRAAFVADPQGVMFYIMKPKPPADQPGGGEQKLCRCRTNDRPLCVERTFDTHPSIEGLLRQPYIQQMIVAPKTEMSVDELERKLYLLRKRAETEISEDEIKDGDFFYIPSLSARTMVFKGLLLAPQIPEFYVDLKDPELISALCLVHQRFSTNTFPTWNLAHPFRFICHNGEINTIQGNANWMNARKGVLASPLFGEAINDLHPIECPAAAIRPHSTTPSNSSAAAGRETARMRWR